MNVGGLAAAPVAEAKAVKETVVNFEWRLKNSVLKLTPGPQNVGVETERFCYYTLSPNKVELGGTRPYHFRGTMMFYDFGEKEWVKKAKTFSGTSVLVSEGEKTLFLDENISNASGPMHTYILVQLKDKGDGAGAQYSHRYVVMPKEVEAYSDDAYDKEGELIPDLHDTSPTITWVSDEHVILVRQDKKIVKLKLSDLKVIKKPIMQ